MARGTNARFAIVSAGMLLLLPICMPQASVAAEPERAARPTERGAPDPAAQADGDAGRGSPLRGEAQVVGFVTKVIGAPDSDFGWGPGFLIGGGWGNLPFTLGADFVVAYWHSQTNTIPVQAGNRQLLAEVRREDITFFFDLWLRIQPQTWRVRPYVEGFVGTKLLRSNYSLRLVSSSASSEMDSDHDWTSSIGWGAGLDFMALENGSVTLGVRKLTGGTASFGRTAMTTSQEATTVQYDSDSSAMFYMIGFIARIGASDRTGRSTH